MSASDRSRTRPSRSSTGASPKDAASRADRPAADPGPRSVYVHVPFCTRRCEYCDFATAVYDPMVADRYLDRLELELERIPRGRVLDTLYVGGGTPSSLTHLQFERLFSYLDLRFELGSAEFTVEMNPETADEQKIDCLRHHVVGRISLGNQSFDPRVLKALGRDHQPDHTRRALDRLRARGFENLSIDLMFAAPGETLDELDRDLDQLIALGLPHVSAYCLTYEPGTPLTGRMRSGQVERLSAEHELEQYRRVRERLGAAGLAQYEISNYAVPGFESRHNRVYWAGDSYEGVGLGAGSYVGGIRRDNTRSMRAYLGEWSEPHRPPHEAEELDPSARAREQVVLALRTAAGLDERELERRTGATLDSLYPGPSLDRLAELGLVERRTPFLRLTERGFELADSVFVELV